MDEPQASPSSPPDARIEAPPRRRRRRVPHAPGGALRATWHLLQPVLLVLLLLATVVAGLGGAAVWLLRSEEGTRWLLTRLPGLQVQGTQGALLSDHFAADRVVVHWGQAASVTIDGLVGDGLRWTWHPAYGAWVGLQAQHLQARRVDVQTGPPGPRPVKLPRTLDLPLRLHAQRVDVAELQIESLAPMRSVVGERVHLWEPGGREYHAEALGFEWGRARIDGDVSLGARPPFTLQAQARARALDGKQTWTAQARAVGPLEHFELSGTLRGEPQRPGAPAVELDLQSTITPLDTWALGKLKLRTQALDLSALSATAPQTAISGRAEIDTKGSGGPIGAVLELDNAVPGRWDRGRLPVRQVVAHLRSPDGDRNQLVADAFDLQFAQGADAAGRWRGRAVWAGNRLQIDSRIDDLRPQLLDGRASAMSLSGPLNASFTGLPLPPPHTSDTKVERRLELSAQLEGKVDRSPLPVKLAIEGSADSQRIEVRQLHLEAGSAQADLNFSAQRAPQAAWQLRSSGRLSDFDPLPWWPGEEGGAWRSGPHRLSGNWSLDLLLPRITPGLSQPALLQSVVASGTLGIERSVIAGVPVSLQLALTHHTGDGPAPSTAKGELVVGGNRVVIDGQGNPLSDGRLDRITLDLQGHDLAALAPLVRLLPDAAPWAPRGGRADAQLKIEGRWPAVRSEGKAQLQALQAGALEARQGSATWRFDTGSEDPLMLQLDAQGMAWRQRRLEQLHADLRGTWKQHRLDLAAALPLQPPLALEAGLGLRTAAGTLMQLQAEGEWQGESPGGGRWAGRVARLSLLPWSGRGTEPPQGTVPPWVDARDLRTELHIDPRDGLTDVRAAAGQVQLADAATLRWDEVHVDLRGEHPAFSLRADVEPFLLAPLLARAQPGLGWTGDLRLAARIDLKVGADVDGELLFERRDGDLRLSDQNASAPFGLSEVRLQASTHEGRWQAAGSFVGKTLGEASGLLSLKTRSGQRWPGADTPLEGSLQAHVANLGMWGTWVPPGWRLTGEMRTSASIGGRLGAPEYIGEVVARDVGLRNLLEGIDLHDGQLLVRLNGPSAEIERFTLRGGDGRLDVHGQARLVEPNSLSLQVKAERFRALGRVDRQLITSGDLALDWNDTRFKAGGRVVVDEGLFDMGRSDAPKLDDDVTVRRGRVDDTDREPPRASLQLHRNQQIGIDLDLGENLKVRGRGLDTTLGGNLRLGTAEGRLTVHGIVNTGAGSYQAWGQKLEIDRGTVIFSGDATNPALDVLALRPNLDTQVGVAITGTAQQPRVRLYSSTDMSETDKMSWLLLGRASDGLGRADTTLLQRAATALLAGEGESPTDALLRNLGIDQFSLRQSDTDVRDTVISLGKQLSRRWYVGYERGVNATAGTWQLIYRIAQRFTLRAQSGLDNSLDIIWTWRVEAPPAPAAVTQSRPAAPP